MTDKSHDFNLVGLRFPSFYLHQYEEAVKFYSGLFGESPYTEKSLSGWKLGDSWLTIFESVGISPKPGESAQNCEFGIQVGSKEEVDKLYKAFIDAGAKKCMEPNNTEMYVPMRFSCVDDPFGIRIDIFFPL